MPFLVLILTTTDTQNPQYPFPIRDAESKTTLYFHRISKWIFGSTLVHALSTVFSRSITDSDVTLLPARHRALPSIRFSFRHRGKKARSACWPLNGHVKRNFTKKAQHGFHGRFNEAQYTPGSGRFDFCPLFNHRRFLFAFLPLQFHRTFAAPDSGVLLPIHNRLTNSPRRWTVAPLFVAKEYTLLRTHSSSITHDSAVIRSSDDLAYRCNFLFRLFLAFSIFVYLRGIVELWIFTLCFLFGIYFCNWEISRWLLAFIISMLALPRILALMEQSLLVRTFDLVLFTSFIPIYKSQYF